MLNTRYRTIFFAALILLVVPPARAQFDFEDADAGADPAAAPPATAASAPAPVENAANDAALAGFARHDAIVGAVLELPRVTAAQKLNAILALIDLRRADVAALLTPDLLAAKLTDAQRAALVRELGPARFMQLIRLDSPTPEAPAPAGAPAGELAGLRKFAQACLDAAAAEANDPQRIAELVAQLDAPEADQRYAARVDLSGAGDLGMVATVHALAVAKTPKSRGHVLEALAEMRPAIDAPLIALLADGRGPIRADVATLVGQLKIRAALPWLAAVAVSSDNAASQAAITALQSLGLPLPTPADAQALLRQQSANSEAIPFDRPGDEIPELREQWWSWDAAKSQLASAQFAPRQQRTLARARLTRALIESGASIDPVARREFVIDALEEAELLGRKPAAEIAQQFAAMSPAELSAALAEAVRRDRTIAAVQIAGIIAARQDATVLATGDGRPSPLADALKSPDRDLRYAALTAVMQLNPQHTFPGASFVPKALWYFAAGAGEPAAVVAAPVQFRASDWAGLIRGLGYEAMPVVTGRGVIAAAIDASVAPRLAVIVLDSDVSFPVVREVIYQLHSADRTAGVPILIAASPEHFAAAQQIAAHDPLVLAEPRPQGEAALSAAISRALALAIRPQADRERRTAQAAQALNWLAALLAADAPYDEIRRDGALAQRSLYVKELAEPAIHVLAALGTADSQTALADYASAGSAPIEARRAAADALAANIKRHGIQLTTGQILEQYDRYNASATADADTQAVLGHILDLLEKKK